MPAGLTSFYFTLFKKFQVINHIPERTVHGAAGGGGTGFDMTDPNAPFGIFSATPGVLAPGDTNPADSPLWALLNSKATGGPNPITIAAGPQAGTSWPQMPLGLPPAWGEFQTGAPSPTLLDDFATWITQSPSQINDTPTGALGSLPSTTIPGVTTGSPVSLFVSSIPGDVGTRPLPPSTQYWVTSPISLVDPTSGATVSIPGAFNPAVDPEYFLVAVVGNNGGTDAGRFLSPTNTGVTVEGWVMVWNTTLGPAFQLPALSNLDATSAAGEYDQFILRKGSETGCYDVAGFRMNVQGMFDGLVNAVDAAVTGGTFTLPPGVTTGEQFVRGGHVCAKVLIYETGSTPPALSDSPLTVAAVAQKNLAPFAVTIMKESKRPIIRWENFAVGQPSFVGVPGAGKNTLVLETTVPQGLIQLHVAIPKETYGRFFGDQREGTIRGFEPVTREEIVSGRLGAQAQTFGDAVILRHLGGENAITIPPLPVGNAHGFALGIEYVPADLREGTYGEISVVHRCVVPKFVPGSKCFELEDSVAGGFTLVVQAAAGVL